MASYNSSMVAVSLVLVFFSLNSSAQLTTSYYSQTCPSILETVKHTVEAAISVQPLAGASLLRLHFHDCFVNGCDASVLLDDREGFTGEKSAFPNANSLRGFDIIDAIKSRVEKLCPGTVSCADILTIAARDSVVALGGSSWDVPLGRRDSRTASATAANNNLPGPASSLNSLIEKFGNKGFTAEEMVTLSGAHSIGVAKCQLFRNRIYNETNIDTAFANNLKGICPSSGGDSNQASFDSSGKVFDNNYYKDLASSKGLLHSDQELYNGGSTDAQVTAYSNDGSRFLRDFAAAMVKMGNLTPLTGDSGEIRTNCRRTN